MINYEDLANILLDRFCEREDLQEAIQFLLENGYNKSDLLELKFSEDDIKRVTEQYIEVLQEEYEKNLSDKNLNPTYVSWRNDNIEFEIKNLKKYCKKGDE